MVPIDKNYLRLQFWNKVYQKNATEFQSFFEDIMQKAFSDFQKIRPYGNQGDRGNDGCRPDEGIYYQVYSPKKPREKEADAAKKLKKDFETLKAAWNQISKIKTFYFVFNDKGDGVSIEIDRALAELKDANPYINFRKLLAKDLEDIFVTLKPDQILTLGFDIDSTNALRIAQESLAKLEVDLDRDNGKFVLRALENHKDIISGLKDENLLVEYEILECRAFQKLERTKEAKQKYENLCKRYPNDPRAFLYLAEIHLNNEDFEKNEELLKEAERIDSSHWLLALEKLIREYRLGKQIDVTEIDEDSFPADPRVKSNFYRLYAVFLHRAGDQARAESFIERAIHLNPEKMNNYYGRLSILEGRIFPKINDKEKFQKDAEYLLSEIDALQEKANEWGELNPRNQATLNLEKINVFLVLENVPEIERLAKESFEMIMQCYFDYSIDNLLVGLLTFVELPPRDFERLLHYLQVAEKAISDSLARMIVIQFNLKTTLFTEGKKFFEVIKKKTILDFIENLEKKEYDEAWIFLKEDLKFAVAMANTAKQFPDFRKKIIENLPDDGNIQKEKLLLLLNYDEKNINEAFDLLKGFDLSNLSYFGCKPILEIAQQKKAWDFVIKIVEKLLKYEREKRVVSQLKLLLFSANFNLERFPEAIQIGEEILSDSEEIAFLDDHNKEVLLGNTLVARLKRGKYLEAKGLMEKYPTLSKSFEFKVAVETEVYLKNNDAHKALASVVAGVRIRKTPTPEQYGSLYMFFVQIGNLIDFPFTPQEKVEIDCFVKLTDQERWYFVGDKEELDATKVPPTDKKYPILLGKTIGEKVAFDDKYRSSTIEHVIENILPIEKYILWQCMHHAQQLSLEHRWNVMEMIEVPTTGEGIETKFIIARLEDEKKKGGDFFDFYCRENVPLAFFAANEGGLTRAIGRITSENRGFIRFSSGDLTEINQQKEVAKKIISGEPFYIDGTSALVLSEPGLLEKIYEYLPNLKVPQSVITLLLETGGKFRYMPGQLGHMGYVQGKLTFSSVDQDTRETIQRNFENSIKLLESKPQNISAISAANKADSFSEQRVPAELCDACILAQKDNVPVLTEDFLYLKANELDTKKKAPEYCSAYALVRVLYEQKKITFENYLNFFAYLSSYRFRFLHLTVEDIEKAVFGDGIIITVQSERIKWFNFPLTLSEQYGVPFVSAFGVVVGFLKKVLIDDAILPEITERIFVEILSAFPTDKDKRILGKMFLTISVKEINRIRQTIIIGTTVQKKIDLLSEITEIYSAKNNLWIP
jgi:hypothetical protein